MEQDVLIKADIRQNKTKKRKMLLMIYYVAIIAFLIFGFTVGTYTHHLEGGTSRNGYEFPDHDIRVVGWYSTPFFEESEGWNEFGYYQYWGPTSRTYPENIVIVVIIVTVLLGGPAVVMAIHQKQCKQTQLTVTESQVFGSYNRFITKKNLQMPIEKIDNMTVTSGFGDKLRTGQTLGISSGSGIIRLHFVQNADDVVKITMEHLEDVKRRQNRMHVITQPINIQPDVKDTNTMDKLKELASMRNSGLISEEEFQKKRKELLTKM